MAITAIPPHPFVPDAARDLLTHEANGIFLGWTYQIRTRFTLRPAWYFIRPDGNTGHRCASLLDAVNSLRGPAGLTALIDDHA